MSVWLDDSDLLTWVIFLPVVTSLLLLSTSVFAWTFLRSAGLPAAVWRVVGIGAGAANFALCVFGVLERFDPERIGFQLERHVAWLPEYGFNYYVGVDGISLFLVLLTGLLFPVALVASRHQIDRGLRSFVFFMLALETGILGAFLSLNLLQFYFFFEVMLIPMYFIIGVWGGSRRIFAATKFFVFTMLGSVMMMVAILVVYQLNHEQGNAWNLDLVSLPGSDALALLDTVIATAATPGVPWWQSQTWLFAAFALAFAIKVPVVPLHTWLPDAHVEAPAAGSVILAALLLKLGSYGFVRFALPLFPNAAAEFAPLFGVLALLGILYGSLVAYAQKDIKRLVAYSSVAHMGFVVLGLFSFSDPGITGSIVQMIAHGLATGALFLIVGAIYERRGTREIAALGGLAKPMPVLAVVLGIIVMASIGLPALSGFVGEFLILLGVYRASPWTAGFAALGIVLGATYMLSMYRRVALGPVENPENRGLIDLDWRERGVFLVLIVPIFWIGLYPNPMLRRVEPSVLELLRVMNEREGQAIALEQTVMQEHEAAPEAGEADDGATEEGAPEPSLDVPGVERGEAI